MEISRVALAVLLTVLVAGAASLAGASKITLYSDMGCAGDTHTIVNCGYCQNLVYNGGYKFAYSGDQPLKFYARSDCRGEPAGILLTGSDSYCGGLKWHRSVRLFCSSSEAAAAGEGAAVV